MIIKKKIKKNNLSTTWIICECTNCLYLLNKTKILFWKDSSVLWSVDIFSSVSEVLFSNSIFFLIFFLLYIESPSKKNLKYFEAEDCMTRKAGTTYSTTEIGIYFRYIIIRNARVAETKVFRNFCTYELAYLRTAFPESPRKWLKLQKQRTGRRYIPDLAVNWFKNSCDPSHIRWNKRIQPQKRGETQNFPKDLTKVTFRFLVK